jgi:hypothetical protein
VITFAGQGYTDAYEHFYVFPSDLKGDCSNPDDSTLLSSAVSADKLADWLQPVNASEIVLILDACNSAASVESNGFKPGPLVQRSLVFHRDFTT